MATFETEIRKLQPVELFKLTQYLDESNYWKKLMAIVPKDDDENEFMFSHDHFRMIEQAIQQQKRSGADIFLSEWSTLNKKRPSCKLLLDLLVKLEFFKAADYLAVDVLKVDPPERPKHGPGAAVDTSDKMLEKLLREQAGIETGSADNLSWSVNYVETPIAETVPVHVENVPSTDLIEFSVDRSDMIKFSEDDLEKQVDRGSSSTKLETDNEVGKSEVIYSMKNYGLQVVDSREIPRCVNDDDDDVDTYSNDQNSTNLTTATNSEPSSSSSIHTCDSGFTPRSCTED